MFQTLAVAASLLTVEPPSTGDELLDGGSPSSSGLSGWVQEEVAPIPEVVVTITGPAVPGPGELRWPLGSSLVPRGLLR
jgi:hypothetical protein